MLRETVIAFMLGLPLVGAAEEAPPQAPAAAVADFAAGFQRLVALGLPSLEAAGWGTAGDESRGMEDYELREILADLKGKGWTLQQDGKTKFLPLGHLDSQEIPSNSGGGLLGKLFGGSKKEKSSDLAADANKLSATLGDPDKSKEFRQALEYRGNSAPGRLLIFATQLHQSGLPAEANRLANAVFSLGANPESVIDAAINHLATRDLGRVTESFFTSKDWTAYERDLRALGARYPRGWDAFPAVQMLLPAVADRGAGELPAKPSIDGATLNPEAIAALDATLSNADNSPDDEAVNRYAKENGVPLTRLTPDMRRRITEMLSQGDGESSGGPWLIEEPPGAQSKDPWSRVKRLGLDALPALAAVANDGTLTFSRNASSDRYSSSSSGESPAEMALQAYQAMDRPLTRGELACRLLAATLPGEDHDESGPQALADSAMEFWKAHRKNSKLELLLVFLAEGDSSQKQIAGTALAEMPAEAAHQAFEKHVLESEEITSTLGSVPNYLKLRKAAAKDFFTRFSATLKAQLDGVDLEQISGGYEIKQAGGVNKYLKKLSLFVSGESPRKLVLELAKAEKPDIRQINSLASTVSESSPGDLIPLYLEAAVTATHLKTRAAFISSLFRQAYNQASGDQEDSQDTPVPSAQIPNWTTLLGDERSTLETGQIRILAARLLEQFHSPATLERISEIHHIDPAAYTTLILARANARLVVRPSTPLPDADQVSAARVEEMLQQLAAARPAAVHELVQSWKTEEKLAFRKWRSEPENLPKLPPSLLAARNLLVAPPEYPGMPSLASSTEILDSLDLKPGTKIDADKLTALATSLAPTAKKNSGLHVMFSESPLSTGLAAYSIRAFDGPASQQAFGAMSEAYQMMRNTKEEAVVLVGSGSGYDRRGRNQLVWKLDAATVVPPEPEALQKFRDAMANQNTSDGSRTFHTISILHRDDLEKTTKLYESAAQENEPDETPDE